ncbi:unnamed protein product [Danaus chrysippus]|uniref:(African queen) hypothetical protein n=1 Tax=Danaus chrysippus TaxID=151541 RepID=A0A8J2QRA2_9NEOP|nr:unnamed protein product [Danaus chrysippus]
MNELLQKHGCANVFSIPEGLKELMSDISREVLREQPKHIFAFISNYLSVMMLTREHGVMAVSILEDLCDCRPSVSQHLIQLGMDQSEAENLSEIIKEEIEAFQADEKDSLKESQILKRILKKYPLDEVMTTKVCQVARNAYRDYWYRKKSLEKSLKIKPEEPWEIAAQRTLELYKRTKPSMSELTRATEKIQAAYRGYHVRRNILRHLKQKPKKKGPKVDLPGAPLDVAESREIDLGPLLSITVKEDDIRSMFEQHTTEKLGLQYDPMKTITHVPDEDADEVSDYIMSRDRFSRSSTGERRSRTASVADERSRVVSISKERPSYIIEEDTAMQKISFSLVPPQVFPDESTVVPVVEDQEIKEVLAPEDTDITDTDTKADEVPEDLPESEGEAESVPTTSVASSAPETAPTSEAEQEDAGEEDG